MYDRENIVKALKWLVDNFPKIENPGHYTDDVQNCINKYCSDAVDYIEHLEEEVDYLSDIVNSYDKLFSEINVNENVVGVLENLIRIIKENKEKIINIDDDGCI